MDKKTKTDLKKHIEKEGWKVIRWTAGLLALFFVVILKYVLQGAG